VWSAHAHDDRDQVDVAWLQIRGLRFALLGSEQGEGLGATAMLEMPAVLLKVRHRGIGTSKEVAKQAFVKVE
jgi:hypothetical protein